jgi:chromosome segregation ATPase
MKFFNIVKANAEIEKHEATIATLTGELTALKDNAPQIEAAAEALRNEKTALEAKAAQVESDLATAKQTISTLTGERDAISAQLMEANKKLANPGEQIKNAASAQAAAIVAASGHTPIAAAPEVKTDAGAKEREAISKLSGVERAIAAHKLKNVQTK